ncbi:MAG: hypothetical protein M0P01_14565 [Treponema sp.]|nr:hypothetical protein [Treponema sp.]
MMYPYITLADDTVIIHSDIKEKNGEPAVEVNFERPVEDGFISARCELPSYHWLFNKGFSDKDISFFEELLHHNAHTIFEFARKGGMCCA